MGSQGVWWQLWVKSFLKSCLLLRRNQPSEKAFSDIYLLVAEQVKKSPQYLVLEDTAHGVEAAKTRMVCIATPSGCFSIFSKADYIRPD